MTSIVTKKPLFIDLDLMFKAHPETGALSTLKNEEAIKQEIKNLIFTNKYEKLFQPNIYGDLHASLFESFDPISVQAIKAAIRDVINNYVDRAELVEITLTDRLEDSNGIEVTVIVKPVNFQKAITIELFLVRIR